MWAHYIGAGRSVPSSIVWSATLRRWIASRLDPHPPRRTIWSAVGWGPTLSESSFREGTVWWRMWPEPWWARTCPRASSSATTLRDCRSRGPTRGEPSRAYRHLRQRHQHEALWAAGGDRSGGRPRRRPPGRHGRHHDIAVGGSGVLAPPSCRWGPAAGARRSPLPSSSKPSCRGPGPRAGRGPGQR